MATSSQARGSFLVPAQVSGATAGQQPRAVVPRNSAVRRQVFAPTSDPAIVAKQFTDLQSNLGFALTTFRSNPLTSSALLQGVAATSGTAFRLNHRLGRVPKGWLVVDSQTASWSGYRVPPSTLGALGPSGGPQEADYLTIHPTATGTFSFLVF